MAKATQESVQRLAPRADPEGEAEEAGRRRAALYARVSTEEQAQEGYSIEGQLDRLKAHARAQAYDVADVYVDAGFTATKADRPAYNRLIEERGSWDVLVVLKMDRIHRNSRNFMGMMDALGAWGKDFDSITERLDTTTAMGRFVMDILQRIAQLESEQIGERTSFGMKTAVDLKGKRAMGQRAPYGYRWSEGDPKRGTGELDLLEPEATNVLEIFRLHVQEGMGVINTAMELGWCTCKPMIKFTYRTLKDGTRKRYESKGKKGLCRGCKRIRYVLNNPIYCGFMVYQGKLHESGAPTLISREVFELAQTRRTKWRIPLPAEEA